jgi:hypothetical protein
VISVNLVSGISPLLRVPLLAAQGATCFRSITKASAMSTGRM